MTSVADGVCAAVLVFAHTYLFGLIARLNPMMMLAASAISVITPAVVQALTLAALMRQYRRPNTLPC